MSENAPEPIQRADEPLFAPSSAPELLHRGKPIALLTSGDEAKDFLEDVFVDALRAHAPGREVDVRQVYLALRSNAIFRAYEIGGTTWAQYLDRMLRDQTEATAKTLEKAAADAVMREVHAKIKAAMGDEPAGDEAAPDGV